MSRRKYYAQKNWFGDDLLQFTGEKLEALAPLADTMSKALTQVGVEPPRELGQLATAFQTNVVAPQAPTGADLTDNVLNFFSMVMGQKQSGKTLTGANKTVADGGQKVLNSLTFTESPWFQAVLVAVVVGAIVALIYHLAK